MRDNLFAYNIDIVYTQLNGFKYYYQTLIILFDMDHLFGHCEVVSSIAHTNSLICTQLNGFKYSQLTWMNPVFIISW